MLLNRIYKPAHAMLVLLLGLSVSVSTIAEEKKSEPKRAEQAHSYMTQSQMAGIVGELAGEYEGTPNNIQFVYNEVVMALISNEEMNRMRIIAPITEVDNLSDDHIKAAMVSNFHLALDARYAIGNGVMYATYIHPLKELTKSQLESAIRQVSTLRLTFGTSYTSGELRYGGRNPREEDI